MVAEVFVQAPGLPSGILVSNLGAVVSNRGRRNYRSIGSTDTHGYRVVRLTDNSKHYIHRLVALAFIGHPPLGKYLVRHLNGIKLDNRVDNLAWGDDADSSADARRLGEIRSGARHPSWRPTCHQGHPLHGANLYVWSGEPSKRRCRTCRRLESRRRREVSVVTPDSSNG